MLRWSVHLEGGPRRVNHAAVAVGHKVYSFGGYCSGEDYETLRQIDVHVFNTGRWCYIYTVYLGDSIGKILELGTWILKIISCFQLFFLTVSAAIWGTRLSISLQFYDLKNSISKSKKKTICRSKEHSDLLMKSVGILHQDHTGTPVYIFTWNGLNSYLSAVGFCLYPK